jgi:hypothetical protein
MIGAFAYSALAGIELIGTAAANDYRVSGVYEAN